MLKHDKNTSVYVVATWSGARRCKKVSLFIKEHLKSLELLNHNLSQIVVMVQDNPQEPKEFTDYINNLPENIKNTKLEVIRRPNVGMSYGAFSDAFAKYRTKFKYYFFMEDDFIFKKHNFDKIHMDLMEEDKSCGYLCALTGNGGGNPCHAMISIGCMRALAMEALWNLNGGKLFPYPNKFFTPSQLKDYEIIQKYGQVGMSLGLIKAGYSVKDITSQYRSEFKTGTNKVIYYGNPKKELMVGALINV